MSDIPWQALPVGTKIGVYEIRRVLGANYIGITYQAWNQHLNSEMVLKEYFPQGIATRAEDGCTVVSNSQSDQTLFGFGLERFLVEAEDLINMGHSNVVRVQNSLQIYDTAYQIMECEKGVLLGKLIQHPDTKLDEDQLKIILLPLLDALEKVHRMGFVHGDINPQNILLKADGEPVLLNFSATKLAMARSRAKIHEVLNPAYAPAEQFDEQYSDAPQSDLYALGATMYQCITGKTPVSACERLSAINRGEQDPQIPIDPGSTPGCSEGFLKCIDLMLALKPEQRPISAAKVVEKLKLADQENGKIAGNLSVSEIHEADQSQLSRTESRSPIPLIITAALGAVVLITAGLWYTAKDTAQQDSIELVQTQSMVIADQPETLKLQSLESEDRVTGETVAESDEVQSEISLQSADISNGLNTENDTLQHATQGGGLDSEKSADKISGHASEKDDLSLIAKAPVGSEHDEAAGSPDTLLPSEMSAISSESLAQAGSSFGESIEMSLLQSQTELDKGAEESEQSMQQEVGAQGEGVADSELAKMSRDEGGQDKKSEEGSSEQAATHNISENVQTVIAEPNLDQEAETYSDSHSGEGIESGKVSTPGDISGILQPSLQVNATPQSEVVDEQFSHEKFALLDDSERLIAKRMVSAEKDLKALRLTTPSGENAMEHFQAILEITPEHPGALAGIQQIVNTYAWMVDEAISKGDIIIAKLYLERAEEINSEAPSLIKARQHLDAAQRSLFSE